MKKQTLISVFFSALALLLIACSSEKNTGDAVKAQPDVDSHDYFRVMFYNTENLFDCYDDSLKNDEQFLPDREKYWTQNKFRQKLGNICKVIVAVGGWEPPEAVGLCEVENRFVLEELLSKTPLFNLDYEIVHHESPDNRGIDVAMLYRKSRFTVITERPIPVCFPFDAGKPTRDILYVKGETYKKDTLHIFINHWPSRWGGQMETEDKRIYVATMLREKADSILGNNPRANIIITGDLNDQIDNESLVKGLAVHNEYENISPKELYNLSAYLQEKKGKGSHKYNGEWTVLDHLIVSGALLSGKNDVYTSVEDAHIYDADFLLEPDVQNVGYKPYRTYAGFKFIGGFSDHLPVYLDLHKK